MSTSVSKSLNRQIVWTTTIVAFIALSVMFVSCLIYGYVLIWLFPVLNDYMEWTPTDFLVIAFTFAVGQSVAAYVGWKLARRLVTPLMTVTEAARAIAEGNFAGRVALGLGTFGEADHLIADFNRMAERLQKAEEELKYSNSAIAHELRTPLTILRGRMQGLADGVFAPDRELFLSLIGHIDALTHIVDDLKTLTLMNAGRMELHLSDFILASEVGDVVRSAVPSSDNANVVVKSNAVQAKITADRSRVRQALLALLENARRYAPDAPLSVEINVNDLQWSVVVTDGGPGLSVEERGKAFDRFWRGDEARTRSKGGAGLGLSVVRAIAEAHGGYATISDPPSVSGVCVSIVVPRR